MNYQTGFAITITTLIFTFLGIFIKLLFKHLKKPENRNVNVFGKQTINNKKETPEEHISRGVDRTNERLEQGAKKFDDLYEKVNANLKKIDELHDAFHYFVLAFQVYVANNGVSKETKKTVKKILEKIKEVKH